MEKINRLMLWLGKFAFPEINTKRTRIQFIPPSTHRYITQEAEPLGFTNPWRDPSEYGNFKRHEVEINKWVYNGKRRIAAIRFGYEKEQDILFVIPSSYVYELRNL